MTKFARVAFQAGTAPKNITEPRAPAAVKLTTRQSSGAATRSLAPEVTGLRPLEKIDSSRPLDHAANNNPQPAPITARSKLSTSNDCITRIRLAPSANRSAVSFRRLAPLAKSKLATLAHAI